MGLEEWLRQNLPHVTVADVMARQGHWICRPPAPPAASQEERAKILLESEQTYNNVFKANGLIALAFPTLPMPAPLINVNGDTPGQRILINGKQVDELDAIILNLFWGPRLGVPGLSLPSGMADDLPVGLEFEGLAGDDSRIISLGIAAERVLGRIPAPAI
jgi:indoleacetamide hydrolase